VHGRGHRDETATHHFPDPTLWRGQRVALPIPTPHVLTIPGGQVGCTKDAFGQWAARVLALGYAVGRVEEMPGRRVPPAPLGPDPVYGSGFKVGRS
jgi:hypothetical protein